MNLNDREDLRALRAKLEAALNAVDPSLSAKLGRMTFDRNGNFVKFGVELFAGKSQADMDLEAAMLTHQLFPMGVVPGLGKAELVGYNRRARKYPFVVRCEGKDYKLSLTQALVGFGGESRV